MPVRGGSRSRYSITNPYLTMPDVTRPHMSTMSGRQFADDSSADKFMTGNGFHDASATRNFPACITSIWLRMRAGQRLRHDP